MPRASEPVDDTTRLDASRIDVRARIGWLLRVSRTAAGLSLRQLSTALAERGTTLSAASLSRIESEGQRSVPALEGYAAVLGLPEGGLRVPVDYLCQSFAYGPPPVLPPPEPGLAAFSDACRAVGADQVTGVDWLSFSRHHADDTGFGLPAHLMEPHVRRLALEQCRSVGLARWLRYEALAGLRRSRYGDVVLDVVVDVLREPGIQVVEDLVTAMAERPTPGVVAWNCELLRHPSVFLVRAASYTVQSMLVDGGTGLDDWRDLPAAFDEAWCAADGDRARREVLAQLRAALPAPLQKRLTVPPPPAATGSGPRVWTRSRQNRHYGFASSVAHLVTSHRGLPDDPMLARLLFESLFERRGVRMSTSTVLLAASPYAADLVRVLLAERTHGPDAATAPAASRVAAYCHVGDELPDLGSLLESDDPAELPHLLRIFGDSGLPAPEVAVERGLSGDDLLVRSTLVALGLAGDPRLVRIAGDTGLPKSTRLAAEWWCGRGPRIVD